MSKISMSKTVNGKWVGSSQNRWPIGRGVAIYMRPETAARRLDAGVELGDRLIAIGKTTRKLLRGLFPSAKTRVPAAACCAEPTAQAPVEDRKAA